MSQRIFRLSSEKLAFHNYSGPWHSYLGRNLKYESEREEENRKVNAPTAPVFTMDPFLNRKNPHKMGLSGEKKYPETF